MSEVTAPKVFQSITAITAALSKVGIAKDRKNAQQNYMFRGIDDVYNVLAPLLAAHNLSILPRVQERTHTVTKSKGGGDLNFVTLRVNYAFISSVDASMFEVISIGEGMDSGDKATNKAFSAAYKYAVMQAFAIPVEGTPDADSESPAGTEPEEAAAPVTAEEIEEIKQAMKKHKLSEKKVLSYFGIADLANMTPKQSLDLRGFIRAKQEKSGADTGEG